MTIYSTVINLMILIQESMSIYNLKIFLKHIYYILFVQKNTLVQKEKGGQSSRDLNTNTPSHRHVI